jgi:hypothetical protein
VHTAVLGRRAVHNSLLCALDQPPPQAVPVHACDSQTGEPGSFVRAAGGALAEDCAPRWLRATRRRRTLTRWTAHMIIGSGMAVLFPSMR